MNNFWLIVIGIGSAVFEIWTVWKLCKRFRRKGFNEALDAQIMVRIWGVDHGRVNVAVGSSRGVIGCYDYPNDSEGRALAKLNADTLGHVTRLPVTYSAAYIKADGQPRRVIKRGGEEGYS